MKNLFLIVTLLVISTYTFSQDKDKVVFKKYDKSESFYYNSILKGINEYENRFKKGDEREYLKVDFIDKDFPTDTTLYKKVWYNNPISQGATGTCWCFSATSYMESEVYRITGDKVDLSEMYTVYWEYVERAKNFVYTRGETYFEQGSEANAIPKIWKKYGIVPNKEYQGKPKYQEYHNHKAMISEMKAYLESVKETNSWNVEFVESTIKDILNRYMGTPPTEIKVTGKEITPEQYLKDVLKLRMNDYFSFMSLKKENYFERAELVEADNWRHADDYYNLPLDVYLDLIKSTIEKGYSISICGDISEPGHDSSSEVAIIPSFDIPSEYINEDARQFRLTNKTTTDDHCIHLVGYQIVGGKYWFLIKDSGAGGFDGPNKGYRFYHEDYIKLKMMNILIHKDTAKKILDKIIK